MIKINAILAPVLVAAIRDASKYNEALAQSETIKDATDIDEFLINLGKLEIEVKKQYEALENQNPKMIPYGDFWK
jgi:hypothetical protein